MPQHKDLTGVELHEPKGVSAAAAKQVYVADGAGSGTWKQNLAANVTIADAGSYFTGTEVEAALQESGLVEKTYGVLYITANTTSETATGGGTYDTWTTNWANGILGTGITQTPASGSLTVANAGIYRVSILLSFSQDVGSAAVWKFAVSVNGTPDVSCVQQRSSSSTDIGSVGLGGLLSLSASDVLTLEYARVSGSADPIIEECNFLTHRVY